MMLPMTYASPNGSIHAEGRAWRYAVTITTEGKSQMVEQFPDRQTALEWADYYNSVNAPFLTSRSD